MRRQLVLFMVEFYLCFGSLSCCPHLLDWLQDSLSLSQARCWCLRVNQLSHWSQTTWMGRSQYNTRPLRLACTRCTLSTTAHTSQVSTHARTHTHGSVKWWYVVSRRGEPLPGFSLSHRNLTSLDSGCVCERKAEHVAPSLKPVPLNHYRVSTSVLCEPHQQSQCHGLRSWSELRRCQQAGYVHCLHWGRLWRYKKRGGRFSEGHILHLQKLERNLFLVVLIPCIINIQWAA